MTIKWDGLIPDLVAMASSVLSGEAKLTPIVMRSIREALLRACKEAGLAGASVELNAPMLMQTGVITFTVNHHADAGPTQFSFVADWPPFAMGTKVRTRQGWDGAGRTGVILGPSVYVRQWWAVLLWDEDYDNEPDLVKAASLEQIMR